MSNVLTKPKVRQSNIELLRIVAMVIIVAHHFAVHGGFSFATDSITFNRLWIQFITIGGKLGVNLFVLISGYFLCTTETLNVKKLLKFHFQVAFYSVLTYVVFTLVNGSSLSVTQLVKACLPMTYTVWWFPPNYFVLLLLAPFIAKGLTALSQKQHLQMVGIMAVLWCVIPTVTRRFLESNNLLWFVFLFCVAAYLRKYPPFEGVSGKKLGLFSALAVLATFGIVVLFDVLGMRHPFFAARALFVYEMQYVPMLLLAVLLFVTFQNLKPFTSSFINGVSATTFGIYLIHDNYYVRTFIWGALFKNATYQDSPLLAPYSLLCIVAVFVGCSLIERVRLLCFGKWFDKLLDGVVAFFARRIRF